MKKITLWLFALFTCWQINAQVNAYSFSQSAGTYTEITGGTVLGIATNDDTSFNANPIGFSFVFNGTAYTQFSVNANGFLALGATVSTSYTSLSTGTSNNVIAALNGDLQGNATTGELSYQLSGVAPNRVLTVQWKSYRAYGATGDVNNFQIKLNETTNLIDVVYGAFTQNATARTRQIGLRGASSADFNNRVTTTAWNATTAGSTNAANCALTTTVIPTSGLKFTWTPPVACTGTPVAGTITPVTQTLLTGQVANPLAASGYSSGVSALVFQWQESNDDGATDAWANAVGGTGATTPTYTPPAFSGTPIYYRLVVTCTPSASSANTTSVLLTSCTTVTAFTENFDTTTTPGFPGCWAKVGALGSASTQTGTPNSAPNTLYIYGTSGTAQAVVAMKPVSNLGAGTHRIKFDMRANLTVGGIIEFGYLTNPADATTFISLNAFTASSLTYTNYVFNVPVGTYSDTPAFRHTGVPANSILIDNVAWEPVPACPDQTGLVVGNITSSGADTSWDDMSATGALGYEYAITTSATPPASGTATTSTFYIASGLLPQTVYYLHVRSTCTGSTFGNWTTTTFKTACSPITALPWSENFDALATGTNIFPSCWGYQNTLSTWSIATAPTAYSGANSLRRTWSTDGWAFTPMVTLTAGVSYRFSYYVRTNDTTIGYDNTIAVGNSQSDVAMTTTLLTQTGYQNPTWTKVNNEFTPTTTGDYSFGIRSVAPGAPNGINFDDFKIELSPTCPDQTGLVVGNITSSGADTSWDDMSATGALGYEYAITTSATPPASGAATTSTFYIASGLLPQTVYYLHVRSTCTGSTFGNWSTVSFTTLCNSITTLPWSENFDALVTGTNIFPSCWGYQNTLNTWSIDTAPTAYSGANSLRRTWSTDGWAFTPMVTLTAGVSYRFSYYVRTNDATIGYDNTIAVGNSQSAAAMTTTLLTQTGYQNPTWTKVNNEFTPTTTGDYSFGLHVVAPIAPNGINFDDFRIELSPTCPDQTGLVVGNITASGADTSWDDMSVTGALGYEYAITTSATPPASGTATTSTFYIASGLLPQTVYYLHVRSTCTGSTFGNWATISFTTACTSVNVPYSQNFESATVPNLPLCTSQQNVGTGNLWQTVSAPGYGFTTKALRYSYNGANAANVWFYSTGLNLVGGTTYKIAYDYGSTGATFPEKLKVAYGTSASAAAMTTPLADHPNVVNATPLNNVVQFTPATTGVYYFGFNAYSDADEFYLFVDNIVVDVFLSSSTFDKSTFTAYPNPVKDVLNLSYKTAISNVKVINLLGQEVLNTKTNGNDVQVNMSALNAGAYIVNITVEDTVHTIKVIKE